MVPSDFQWLSTSGNPRKGGGGVTYDAGVTGWRLHAIKATEKEKFGDIKYWASLCGLIPRYGWDIDMFIETKCERCEKKFKQLTEGAK
jgi:hypothetical protein